MDCRVEPWCENCRGGETKPAKEGDGAVVQCWYTVVVVLVQCWYVLALHWYSAGGLGLVLVRQRQRH